MNSYHSAKQGFWRQLIDYEKRLLSSAKSPQETHIPIQIVRSEKRAENSSSRPLPPNHYTMSHYTVSADPHKYSHSPATSRDL
jgi:hypothetical protein